MNIIDERRVGIQRWLASDNAGQTDHGALHFENSVGETVPLEKKATLDEQVLEVLSMASRFPSHNSSGEFETRRGAMRSPLDIWRHTKGKMPRVTVYRVMESIWSVRDQLYGHYCPDISRTVFERNRVLSIDPEMYCRDFRLCFTDWETLH